MHDGRRASDNRTVAAIQCEIEPVGTRLLVRVTGELSVSSAPQLRMALLKCLVEQPDAVVVDVAEMVVAERAATAVFLAVSRQAALWPGTPLLIAAPSTRAAGLLTQEYGRLAVFESTDAALSALPRHQNLTITEVFLPASGAARRARNVASAACLRWDLAHLVAPASLIASELVTNAVQHAGTMLNLKLSLGHRYLMVAVRDGSTAVPVRPQVRSGEPEASRGLLLVEVTATRWGSLPASDGKVVWATLPRRRREDGAVF
jgi:anti-anti-sigma regulatory factor/anti-sigma regulatory factor (Ser/Thr protein kinase)